MKYSNTLHGYWFLGITVILICLNNQINTISETYISLFCLFLILTIGISHGSLDNLKGNKILKLYKIKNKFIFYLFYIVLALLFTSLWLLISSFTLMLFLIIASYHFGKEDCAFINWDEDHFRLTTFSSNTRSVNKTLEPLYHLIKGSIIILAPLALHFNETLSIFEILFIDNVSFKNILIHCDNNRIFVITLWITAFISLSFFIETACIIALNIFFSPLVAFTIYFCFLHSIRHSASLIKYIIIEEEKVWKEHKRFVDFDINGVKKFVKKALPLTLITAILFIVSVYFLTNYYVLDDAILKVIFIGLASLTFPHILLEYLLEKNEK